MVEYKNFTNECGIYCFKNLINNKCYIGQAVNLKRRLRSHYNIFKSKTNLHLAFYKAVDKYGINNFDLEILEYVDPNIVNIKEVLDSLEKKYIQKYNSYGENGYNMTQGGDAGVLGLKMTDEQKDKIRQASSLQAENTKVRIWCRELSKSEYSFGLTYEGAANKSGVCIDVVTKICNNKYIKPYAKGWTFANDEITLFHNCLEAFRDMAKGTYKVTDGKFYKGCEASPKVKRVIVELDVNNNIINEYESIKMLSELLNVPDTSLGRWIRKGITKNKLNGRIFKYKK